MKKMHTITGIAAFMAVAAQAALIQVDFGATGGANGTTTEGGTTWNGVEPGTSGSNLPAGGSFLASDLVDSTNAGTIVDLTLDWSNQSGLDFSRAWDLNLGDRDGDYLGVKGDNAGVFNTATFSSLTIGAFYDVTVWTQAPTDFRANGGTVAVVAGSGNSTAVNAAVSYTFTDVAADAFGEIAIDWGHITTSRGANQWASVTAMSIVPEPGTYALLAGLTGLVFVMVRRRR
jgi:hypothetical protein